jgi:hypothetical protein
MEKAKTGGTSSRNAGIDYDYKKSIQPLHGGEQMKSVS